MTAMNDDTPVLVVDDDPPTQKLLETLMRRQGFGARIVSDGAEAIDCLRDGEFACVILDLMMPAVGGIDVIDYLAAERRRTPVIVCTAAGGRSTDGLDRSIVRAIVRKPFDIDELAALVTELVNERVRRD
jgi:DNA-binding response OmpR family regulator